MFSSKEFKENLEAVSSIKSITSIYQEIASIRMKQIRDGVERTREFLDGVAQIYNHAKADYITIIRSREESKKIKDWRQLKFIKRNSKSVIVFLSANEHLYGELILNIWDKFRQDAREAKDDIVVVGTFGKYLVKNEKGIGDTVKYFDLDDDQPTVEQISNIVNYIDKYERIFVYYGQLVTVLNQIPTKQQISGGVSLGETAEAKRYLFEPSPEKILEFFEGEIIAALFNQKVFEHQLARFAARMVAMDQATENASEILKKLDSQFKSLKRRTQNKKQLEVFAGFSLWSEKNENKELPI